jgi:hypothetical protein
LNFLKELPMKLTQKRVINLLLDVMSRVPYPHTDNMSNEELAEVFIECLKDEIWCHTGSEAELIRYLLIAKDYCDQVLTTARPGG